MSKFVTDIRRLRDPKALPGLLRKIAQRRQDVLGADSIDEIEHAAETLERAQAALARIATDASDFGTRNFAASALED